MQRRTDSQAGWVNFPTDSKDYSSTREGGMFVKLVVVDNRSVMNFNICCGAFVIDKLQEVLVGDDKIDNETEASAFHYPGDGCSEHSRAYLASIVLGSTGWSGCCDEGYWKCTYEDLTRDGKRIYDKLHSLYKGCDLRLLTFLDT